MVEVGVLNLHTKDDNFKAQKPLSETASGLNSAIQGYDLVLKSSNNIAESLAKAHPGTSTLNLPALTNRGGLPAHSLAVRVPY